MHLLIQSMRLKSIPFVVILSMSLPNLMPSFAGEQTTQLFGSSIVTLNGIWSLVLLLKLLKLLNSCLNVFIHHNNFMITVRLLGGVLRATQLASKAWISLVLPVVSLFLTTALLPRVRVPWLPVSSLLYSVWELSSGTLKVKWDQSKQVVLEKNPSGTLSSNNSKNGLNRLSLKWPVYNLYSKSVDHDIC